MAGAVKCGNVCAIPYNFSFAGDMHFGYVGVFVIACRDNFYYLCMRAFAALLIGCGALALGVYRARSKRAQRQWRLRAQ